MLYELSMSVAHVPSQPACSSSVKAMAAEWVMHESQPLERGSYGQLNHERG